MTVSGEVTEYYPDQSDTPSALPIAEIEHTTVTVVSTGNPLPPPVIIGQHGMLPPAQNIYGGGRWRLLARSFRWPPCRIQKSCRIQKGWDSVRW